MILAFFFSSFLFAISCYNFFFFLANFAFYLFVSFYFLFFLVGQGKTLYYLTGFNGFYSTGAGFWYGKRTGLLSST
jgi:hypothetical protein